MTHSIGALSDRITLIEFICAAGFFAVLLVLLIVLVMLGMLSRRITKLEKRGLPNHTHWTDSSRNRPDEQAFIERAWDD